MMKKLFLVWVVLSAASISLREARAAEIPLPAPEAYRKAVFALRNMGAFPTFMDPQELTIRTDAGLTRLTAGEADCGSRFGKPYITDRKVKTTVAYEVGFRGIDEKRSHMDLKIVIDGYVDVFEGNPGMDEKPAGENKRLICRSTGALEKKFEEVLLK